MRVASLVLVAACAGAPALPDRPPGLEPVVELPAPPGNVAVTPGGAVIFTQHPFGNPDVRVRELLPDGSTRPFPNEAWAGPRQGSGPGIAAAIGIRADAEGVVWILDLGDAVHTPRLIGWDTESDRLATAIEFPASVLRPGSFLQDLAIDRSRMRAYVADPAGPGADAAPAILVVDLETGAVERKLENHAAVRGEDVPLVIEGAEVRPPSLPGPPRFGVNPITIDPQEEWVYFGAMHGTSVWRVRAEELVELPDPALAGRVERYGDKPPSDGITVDEAGHVYVTDLGAGAIGIVHPGGAYHAWVESPSLSWPDGFGCGPDGYVYVTVNQLHRTAALAGADTTRAPFRVMRFRPLAPCAPGR